MKKTKPLYSSPCSLGEIEEQNKKKNIERCIFTHSRIMEQSI